MLHAVAIERGPAFIAGAGAQRQHRENGGNRKNARKHGGGLSKVEVELGYEAGEGFGERPPH
jgi:hypothetical protein